MKKGILFVILLLINILSVNATISVDKIDIYYSIGDKLSVDVNIIPYISVQALLSAEIICEEFQLIYFVKPIILEKNKEITAAIPEFEIIDETRDNCIIDINLKSIYGTTLEKNWTNPFEVTEEKIKIKDIVPENITIQNKADDTNIEEDTEDEKIESVIDVNKPKISTEKNIINASDNKYRKGLLYFLIIIMIIALSVFFYLKLRNKNKFNRGWKLLK